MVLKPYFNSIHFSIEIELQLECRLFIRYRRVWMNESIFVKKLVKYIKQNIVIRIKYLYDKFVLPFSEGNNKRNYSLLGTHEFTSKINLKINLL